MPVAGTIKLDIIADSQDRASATLRAVQGELRKTEDRIRSVSAAGKEDGDISDILSRGSEKSRTSLRAEVDAREAAARTRREAVKAARDAANASDGEGGALSRLKGKIEGANKAKEFFNKTLGIAGFVGIAVTAVAGFVELINEATGYQSAIRDAAAQQDDFNRRLAETAKGNRAFTISRLSEGWQSVAKAQDEVLAKTEEYFKNQADRANAEGGVAQAEAKILQYKERIRDVEEDTLGSTLETLALRREVDELEQKRNYWANQVATSLREEPGLLDQIKAAQERSNVPLIGAQMAASDLSKSLRDAEGFAGGVGDALTRAFAKVSWNPLEGLDKKKPPKPPGGGGDGSAERERGLRREIQVQELALKYQDEHDRKMGELWLQRDHLEEDLAAKRIRRSTFELEAKKLDNQFLLASAAFEEKVAADAAKADEKRLKDEEKRAEEKKDGIEKAAKAAKTAQEKSDKDAADALEKRAKGIERIGEYAKQADGPLTALTGRLGGLAEAVDQTAGIWARYERGQETVGDAVSSTLGFIGAAVAQSISDKKVQAGVEGGFEAAASIASFASGNVPAGIGHAAAAAAFFGVAAGGGAAASTASAGAGSGSGSSNVIQGSFGQSSRSSRPEDTRTVIVHHYGQGIIYGQGSDVARAGRNADRSLAGTGMQNTGY